MAPKADGVEKVAVEQNSSTNDESMEPHWKQGDRVHAQWRGNGCYYLATVNEVYAAKRAVLITWDDEDGSHREISFDNIMEPAEETQAWNTKRIDRRVNVQDTPDKGRCLYTNEVSDPGQVVFVEKPCLVALPGLSQNLWNHLTKMHEATPLQLGTVTFHFAALLSELQLDKTSIGVIMDKYVPDPDEEPGDDVVRIMQSIEENKELKEELKLDEKPLDPRKLQRLVSAWRYNSFGHHKEDGLVLYNRISMCSHSCDPTCCWSYGEDDAFVLRSRISLKKGDELTISYLQDEDLLKSTAVRQQKLQNWRFTCACPRCKLYVDEGRGFRCRKCRVGVLYATTGSTLEPCRVCNSVPSQDMTQKLIRDEQKYVLLVENLDKKDVPNIDKVYVAALDIFNRHWICCAMDTMRWEAAAAVAAAPVAAALASAVVEVGKKRKATAAKQAEAKRSNIAVRLHEDGGGTLGGSEIFGGRGQHVEDEGMAVEPILADFSKCRVIKRASRSSGVTGLLWTEAEGAWKLRYKSNQVATKSGKVQRFPAKRYMTDGQSYEEAVEAALQAAIARRQELVEEGVLEDTGEPKKEAIYQSRVPGVGWHSKMRCWEARLMVNAKMHHKTLKPNDQSPDEIERARLLAEAARRDLERESGFEGTVVVETRARAPQEVIQAPRSP
mmetsp:Transcript_32829/g.94456  ORF Transcript_32829/g.94456 Transcript_32829/m.94456 type:complete len:668 (+) Transcript_32829:48-2051(+)